jgi:hypothetical protein
MGGQLSNRLCCLQKSRPAARGSIVEAKGRIPWREPVKISVLAALPKVNEVIENTKKKAILRVCAQFVPCGS